jgi:tetratricopeptide (TPR) repeat protein
MAEEDTNDHASPHATPGSEASSGKTDEPIRRRSLTPEQRRFLDTPRSSAGRSGLENAQRTSEPRPEETQQTRRPPMHDRPTPEKSSETQPFSEDKKTPRPAAAIAFDRKSSRMGEMQNAALTIGALFVLCVAFYVGKKFDYLKYLIASRKTPTFSEAASREFPGVSPGDLVEQALVFELSGKWQEAVDRLIAAKQQNPAFRGILFHLGKLVYDHGDVDNADKIFKQAIAFGENVDAANYYCGLVATRRRDLAAAERFFQAAASAEPFISDYYYYWAEALRLDFHPTEAIPCYEQAANRARNSQDATVCRFKIRMAELEAARAAEVSAAIEEKQGAGPLPVDWLMTTAALNIRQGKLGEALRYLANARNGNNPGLFASCVNDLFFRDACQKQPELAEACRLEFDVQSTFP